MPSYDFRYGVGLTRSQGMTNLLFTFCAPDVSFQRGFLIYVKIRANLQSKKFHFSGLQFIQLTLIKKKKKKNRTPRVSTGVDPVFYMSDLHQLN